MFKRRRSADDFAEEIKAHLELEADELKREGLSEDEARRKARVEFGNVPAAQERFYLKSRIVWLDNLVRDLKFAIRQLVKNPGFAATAILVLALGIGASVAIFAFVDAALLEPLPYANPGRLMSVNESNVESPRWPLSYPDYLDWQRLNKSFSSLDVYSGTGLSTADFLRRGTGTGRARERRLLPNPRCVSHAWARFQCRRESAGRPGCRDPELWGMAPSLRRGGTMLWDRRSIWTTAHTR